MYNFVLTKKRRLDKISKIFAIRLSRLNLFFIFNFQFEMIRTIDFSRDCDTRHFSPVHFLVFIENLLSTISVHFVHGMETRAHRRVSSNGARANTRMEFCLDFLKIIFGPIFRNCCLLPSRARRRTRFTYASQMVYSRERNDSQAFEIPDGFPPVRSFALVIAVASVDSIRTGNVQNGETVVLRERFPKCAYGLIYGILRLLSGDFRRDLPRECKGLRRYDYCKSHRIRCNLAFCPLPTLIRSAIFHYFCKFSHVNFIRALYNFIYFVELLHVSNNTCLPCLFISIIYDTAKINNC